MHSLRFVLSGAIATATGMDFEPEYNAVNKDDTQAFVTLQEANAIAVLDLASDQFTEIIGRHQGLQSARQ